MGEMFVGRKHVLAGCHSTARVFLPVLSWQMAARVLTRINPEAGRTIWRRLFQRQKRLAIARALAA